MIATVHIADIGKRATLGVLRRRPAPGAVSGLRYAETAIAAPLGGGLLPAPRLGRVSLIAAWDDDQAFDGFLAGHPLAERLAGGWHVRLEPLRVSGAWSALPDLPPDERPVDPDEPVAILTLGRLRLGRVAPFLRANAPAAGQAAGDPAVLAATGLARPPRLVATFSLWRSASAMRDYAYGRSGDGHFAAIRAHRARPFHHESAFVRFRPYAARGAWNGREPLTSAASMATTQH